MNEGIAVEIRVERRGGGAGADRETRVREDDLEPHAGLRYIARLFKILSILTLFVLVAEVVIAFVQGGEGVIGTLMVEATRLLIFAAFLWAAGDISLMLIESNHDLRAARILLGRLNAKMDDAAAAEAQQRERRPPA